MKLAIIGGGSTYTPELIDGIGRRKKELPFREIWLFDLDGKRLEILKDFAARQLRALGLTTQVQSSLNLSKTLDGASFVVSQIRVGGQAARQKDTELGLRYGLIGQETVGCGGFACALRHIPASLKIVREMEKRCPDAVLMNFTNPAGLVTQALLHAGKIRVVGICNVSWVMRKDIALFLDVPTETVHLDYFGLNHLSWITGVHVKGKDFTQHVLKNFRKLHKTRYNFPPDLIDALQALPSPYLRYYYMTPAVLTELKKARKTRAQEVMDIETSLLRLYSNPTLNEKPRELMKRGGIYYGEVASSAMSALAGKTPETHVLNLPNEKTYSWLPEDAVIEFPWRITRNNYSPDKKIQIPLAMKALIIQMKAYEEFAIQAALTGDRRAAYQALLANPLIGSAQKATAILKDLKLT